MSVVVASEEAGAWKKRLTVTVPAEEVDSETRQVVRAYAGQVRLPGFRKGKVPAELVRQRYREEIDREVVERLVPRFWERARDEEGLDPLGQPRLEEVGELEAGAPLTFVATVEVRPSIELGELAGFELPDPEVEPTDDEVGSAVDDLRRQIGEWRDAGRPAARGDRVTARIVELGPDGRPVGRGGEVDEDDEVGEEGGEEDAGEDAAEGEQTAARGELGTEVELVEPGEPGEPAGPAELPGERIEVEVGDPQVWEELSLALTGLAPGQEGRFSRRPAEERPESGPRTFRVAVEAVEERELPPLDDELAGRLGDFEDVAALEKAVRDRLRHDKGHERDRARREALLSQLRGRYPLALPEGAVQGEVDRLAGEFADDLARRGLDPRQAQVDWQRLAGELRAPAERRVHEMLILDAVAEREGIEVAPAELEGAIASIARAQETSPAQVRRALGDRVESLRRQIRRQKAVGRLLGDETPGDETPGGEAPAGEPEPAPAEDVPAAAR